MLRLALALALLAAPALADDDAARLAQGEVLVTVLPPEEGRSVGASRARAVIDAPPARLFTLITECGNYQRTMENVREAHEVSTTRGPDGSRVRLCKVTFHLPFPLSDLTSLTRAVETTEPGGGLRRAWKLVEGDYERNEGYWLVEPYGEGGQRSLVTYVLDVQPKISLPSSFVSRVQRSQLKGVMEHLRQLTKQP